MKKNLMEMKRERAAKYQEAREFKDAKTAEDRKMTEEERRQFDELMASIRAMDDDIGDEEDLEALEKGSLEHGAADFRQVPGEAGKPPESEKLKRAAFFKYIRLGKDALTQEERALVQDTTGLYLMPEDLDQEIYRGLPQYNVMRQICAQRTTMRDKVRRRHVTELSVGWGKLETGTVITESAPTPSQEYIYVEDLYGIAKIGEDELMDFGDDQLAEIIRDSFARAVGETEEEAFVIGTGHTYSQPEGITLDAGVIANYIDLDTADTAVPDDLLDIEYDLPSQYDRGASFLMHKKTGLQVRKVKQTYGPYLWQPSLQVGQPQTFDGYPVYFQNDMIYPAADNTDRSIVALFGDFRYAYQIVDHVMGFRIQRLNELYAEDGLVGFKVHFRVGGGVIISDAVRALDNNT